MKKENANKSVKGKRLIIVITVIAILGIIIGTILIRNVKIKQSIEEQSSLAGGNTNSNLIASNIKKGITIGEITGTLESLDTSDADATAEDILWGKTGYVNGVKITGTRVPSSNYTFTDSLGNEVKVPRRICSSKPFK